MSFLNYLDDFEKKLEKLEEVVIEQPKREVTKLQVTETVIQPKKVVKIIKKVVNTVPEKKSISESANRAANILDGIDEFGYDPLAPSSTKYYDNSSLSSKQNNINTDKAVANRAAALLGEDIDSGFSGGLPPPMRDVPQMDIELLKCIPKEMLSPEDLQKVQSQTQIESIANQQPKEVPPEILQMMEQTKQMQQMFSQQNVDMSDIPPEFRNI